MSSLTRLLQEKRKNETSNSSPRTSADTLTTTPESQSLDLHSRNKSSSHIGSVSNSSSSDRNRANVPVPGSVTTVTQIYSEEDSSSTAGSSLDDRNQFPPASLMQTLLTLHHSTAQVHKVEIDWILNKRSRYCRTFLTWWFFCCTEQNHK